MSFLTLEDINGCLYSNQRFWWYELDTANITEDNDFTNVKYDFVTVSRETESTKYKYTFTIENACWTKGFEVDENLYSGVQISGNTLTVRMPLTEPSMKLQLYMGFNAFSDVELMMYQLTSDETLNLNYEELNTAQTVNYKRVKTGATFSESVTLQKGYNLIENQSVPVGYVLVNLVKSDFEFNCNETLTLGKVNTVALGVDTKYKPAGAMIGDNAPNIKVVYKDQTLPVTFDTTLNDYVFDLDLTEKINEGNVQFKVIIEANDVLNNTETDIILNAEYLTITSRSALLDLFATGGTARLTSNITFSTNVRVEEDVCLLANHKQLSFSMGTNLTVAEGKTFKANDVDFIYGKNTIRQEVGSKVELTNCSFNQSTGIGSCIQCDVDINSLDNPTDFTTILDNVQFYTSEMCILSGGNLTVTNCFVKGDITNVDYPYFLYQTDGSAVITNNDFELNKPDNTFNYDLKFNPCIFCCGENAVINGYNRTELMNNNFNEFLDEKFKNKSKIHLTYYYSLIENYIHLDSNNGFCHCVSGEDYIFKTNIQL